MENENDISMPKSVEVDEIIEFYKDKEFNEPEDTPKAQPKKINAVTKSDIAIITMLISSLI